MQAFALPFFFVAILLIVGWSVVDNVRADREGVRRRKLEEEEAQRHLSQSVRDAMRSRR
jgi:choline-glycine betaine transporter